MSRVLLHGGGHTTAAPSEEYSSSDYGAAFGLTIGAAFATGIGSSIALCLYARNKRMGNSQVTVSPRLMSASLGLASGVIIWIGFVDLFGEGKEFFTANFKNTDSAATKSTWSAIGFFFLGILLTAVTSSIAHKFLDHQSPSPKATGGELEEEPREEDVLQQSRKLAAVGFATAFAMALHNIPEGIATFVAAIADPLFGVAVAFAIAFHNIPQGISVAVPILYSSKSPCKAFWISFSCGFSQVLGALIAYGVVSGSGFGNFTFGLLFSMAGGMMVSVASSELLPTAISFDKEGKVAIPAYFIGMGLIAVSIALFSS